MRLLLDAGADSAQLSDFEPGTTLDWAAYGSRHATRELTGDACSDSDSDYVAVVRMLLDQGTPWTTVWIAASSPSRSSRVMWLPCHTLMTAATVTCSTHSTLEPVA